MKVEFLLCGPCGPAGRRRTLVEHVEMVDGVTWTTWSCPVHGAVFTRADAGDLDLGLVREQALNTSNTFRAFAEDLFSPEAWEM